ncbi:MAG: UvrD-helicase domain-containing protein [Candidatus Omnitrophota bacterium]|nr:UvrD-helicase domain-containing protein [Candidatus Omnitrophota bacterium]
MEDKILDGLNPQQKEAVIHKEGPLLIIAGAGTGKTAVITRRIAYLISVEKVKPEEILALTFTDKAAGEMQERVDILVPYGFTDTWISTFHAFGDRVLRENALEMGLTPDFRVLTRPETIVFFREHLFEFPLFYYRPLSDPTKFIEAMITLFSRSKDEDVSSEEYLDYSEKLLEKANKEAPTDAALKEEAQRQIELSACYKKYQELLSKEGKVDFGNQFYLTLELFRKHPQVLSRYQSQFKFILVDEFQDTNYAQLELVKLLAEKHKNLTVVADDDQCVPAGTLIETIKGKKKVEDIKLGQEVITAVGKGYTTKSIVTKIFKNKKTVRFLTFYTESGYKITVTNNHKMFCYVAPSLGKKDLYYVYLMWRQGLGWRLGTTFDLSGRLRIERSADKIIGIKCFSTEEEAAYYEVLYSLEYGIPTVCFMKRKNIYVAGHWLERLYQEIDTEKGARELAKDLDIDLNSHHFCLGAVTRGNKARIKINLELCYRKYSSKTPRAKLLKNPGVSHLVYLETSDTKIIHKLQKAGFSLRKAKKGKCLKIASTDIKKLGVITDKLQKITNGIMEYKFRVGTRNITHGASLVMPASNVLRGHYLPIYKNKRIIYDRITKVTSELKSRIVYDLEIARTHNFIADGVVVHNSIYKWRGAAVSNILNFMNTYAQAKKISLTQNYRSTQTILDSAYRLIQFNNPDRFEVKANIDKRLVGLVSKGKEVTHLHFDTISSEADALAKIIEDKVKKKEYSYQDFAILVRSNSDAQPFLRSLNMKGIPWRFSGNQGLYSREEIRLCISFLRIVANTADSLSLYYLLSSAIYKVSLMDLTKCMHYSSRRHIPLFNILQNIDSIEEVKDISPESAQKINKAILELEKYIEGSRNLSTGRLLYLFLTETKYLKGLVQNPNLENEEKIRNLAKFFEIVSNFENVAREDRVLYFVNYLDMLVNAGDDPATAEADFDTDAVNVLTIHKAKGLEFNLVFLVSLVMGRFPWPHRHDPLELPLPLVKDILPSGDFHIQEERRLFYVGMTRAKKELYLTSALDYGTERQRKISCFVFEALGKEEELAKAKKTKAIEEIRRFAPVKEAKKLPKTQIPCDEILNLSYYQIDDYLTCPLKYKYVHILRVPIMEHHAVLYGKALHDSVQKYFQNRMKGIPMKQEEVLQVFEQTFKPEGFFSREHLEERHKLGIEALKNFYKTQEKLEIVPKFIEKSFSFVLDCDRIIGRWDRIDEVNGEAIIIDFKSSDIKKQKDADKRTKESLQLSIYSLAYKNIFGKLPDWLELHFLESGIVGRAKPQESRLEKTIEEIKQASAGIRAQDFKAKPAFQACSYCAYNQICPFSVAQTR